MHKMLTRLPNESILAWRNRIAGLTTLTPDEKQARDQLLLVAEYFLIEQTREENQYRASNAGHRDVRGANHS